MNTKAEILYRCNSFILTIIFAIVCLFNSSIIAQDKRIITVALDGSGDFKTITAAVQSLPMFNYQRTEIFVKNGIYTEKIKIDQDYITLKGESRQGTILQYSQLRSDWIANKDSIGPAVINLNGDDFILEYITVINTQPQIGPHAFAIYGTGTRAIIQNANIISKGGDTVSLWDYKTGMYYNANCYFEGAVDFVCPRGWCFIRDSKFYEVKKTASIWHAGGDNINQKFVIRNSTFDGVQGFELGRHHYEAQFILLDCTFSANMRNKPIYRVVYEDSTLNRPFNWGERYFYNNCTGTNQNFDWLKDNFSSSANLPKPQDVTSEWTFDYKWKPESDEGPKIISYKIEKGSFVCTFNEKVTVIGNPILETKTGTRLFYSSGGGSDTISFSTSKIMANSEAAGIRLVSGQLTGTIASTKTRLANLFIPK